MSVVNVLKLSKPVAILMTAGITLSAINCARAETPIATSVCEIRSNLKSFDHKEVVIRATIDSDGHRISAFDAACPKTGLLLKFAGSAAPTVQKLIDEQGLGRDFLHQKHITARITGTFYWHEGQGYPEVELVADQLEVLEVREDGKQER
jgi:butyrate kinase